MGRGIIRDDHYADLNGLEDRLGKVEFAHQHDDWIVVGSADGPAFANSWTSQLATGPGSLTLATPSPVQFRRDGVDMVRLRGVLTGGAAINDAFVLPAAYRPANAVLIPTIGYSASAYIAAVIQILTTGGVQVAAASYSGYSFPIDSALFPLR